MQRVSVVISNYNYERYVGTAIDSALGVDWPEVEVVVVDDGSTDGSLEIIRSYGERILILATENGGQRVAVNRGFAACTGDVVIFLDSDDILSPDLAKKMAPLWTPRVSKIQFQMQRITERGAPIGSPFPGYSPVPTSAEIRNWATRTSAYPTPPGSGNAYARWFLERLLPVGPELGDAADSALLAAAPFLGDVICAPGAVVRYRRHSGNDSDLLQDVARFPREVERACRRWCWAQSARGGDASDLRPLFKSLELLQLRVASWRLAPKAHPLPGDTPMTMARDAVLSPLRPGPETMRHRVIVAGWSLATLLTPSRLARQLIRIRYGARS